MLHPSSTGISQEKVFLEEIETGLHPSRLALLLEILHQSAESHDNQIFATSHSPHLLSLLKEETLSKVFLTLKNEENGCSTIVDFNKLPEGASEVLNAENPGDLHTSG